MKKILTSKLIFLILFLLFSNLMKAQQGLFENGLTTNQVLVNKSVGKRSTTNIRGLIDTLTLGTKGFFDDFSYEGPYPDTTFWIDNFVYINRTSAKAPITLGIATFDGLAGNGFPYNFNVTPESSGFADNLTSKPIDLDYEVSDSIYLSFYYQPQGIANAPEATDSLIVEFRNTTTASWKNVWGEKGHTLATNDSSWNLVMIPIKDTAFLKNGFQFRFRNKATLSGNTDHWHIDYVYLNKGRTLGDTLFEDVAFVYNTPSLLKKYSAMPWKQYTLSDMRTDYKTTIRNNFNIVKNTSFTYEIYDSLGVVVNPVYPIGGTNIKPFNTDGYLDYPYFTNPQLNYAIPLLTGANYYTIKSIISSTPDNNRLNDTLIHKQLFSNYFAYDDGTAENSWGLNVLHGLLATKFTLTVADSLQFIDIYFNPFLKDAALYTFNLKVWANAGGVPGSTLYTSSTVQSPVYETSESNNNFARYKLDKPLFLNPGVFYIGIEQNTTEFLNIGVDKNTNTQSEVFFNATGSWTHPSYKGSLMMRPVFGKFEDFVGVQESSLSDIKTSISVFPNPASNELFIRTSENQSVRYFIVDVLGRTVVDNTIYEGVINLESLQEGIYFINLIEGKNITTAKFIKSN